MGKHAQESYVTTAIDALNTDAIEEGSTNLYFTDQRALDATDAVIASASAAAVASSLETASATYLTMESASSTYLSLASASTEYATKTELDGVQPTIHPMFLIGGV